jgi:hypothetical protein
MVYLKLLEKQKQAKLKSTRWEEVIEIRAKINEIETKKLQRINETKSCFLEKTNKINKPLANLTRKRKKIPK